MVCIIHYNTVLLMEGGKKDERQRLRVFLISLFDGVIPDRRGRGESDLVHRYGIDFLLLLKGRME
jgi:hypothetical protein